MYSDVPLMRMLPFFTCYESASNMCHSNNMRDSYSVGGCQFLSNIALGDCLSS